MVKQQRQKEKKKNHKFESWEIKDKIKNKIKDEKKNQRY